MLDGIQAMKAPFFLHVPYLEPHPPYFTPPPYDTLIDPSQVELPEAGSGEGRPGWQVEVRRQSGTELATEADVRKMIAVYYGMIAYVDSQMRRLYEAMERRGLLGNTWIILSSDHGDYLGEKGLFMKSESLYECLLHVPLVIRPPSEVKAPRGEKVEGLVDLVDLFPTILGIAGVAVPEHAQGKDLIAWVKEGARPPLHDCLFAQVGDYHGKLKSTFPGGIPEGGRHPGLVQGGRAEEFAFIKDPDYGDEAYDLARDPKELNNLLQEGGSQAPQVNDLKKRIANWEAECLRLREGLGVIPGYRGFDGET
jgi:arylsulfatase A-like enzyme